MEAAALSGDLEGARERAWRIQGRPLWTPEGLPNHLQSVQTQAPDSDAAEIINLGAWPETPPLRPTPTPGGIGTQVQAPNPDPGRRYRCGRPRHPAPVRGAIRGPRHGPAEPHAPRFNEPPDDASHRRV